MSGFYKNLFQPALEAVGLPASRPAAQLDDGTPMPALEGVRSHDLRHSFVALQLSAGVGALNALPEPPAPAKQSEQPSNVVSLFGQQAN
jgi:integrase